MKDQNVSEILKNGKQPGTAYDPQMGSWKSSEELTAGLYTPQPDSNEEPLLVLKYHRAKLMFRLSLLLFAVPSFSLYVFFIFPTNPDFTSKGLFALAFAILAFVLFSMDAFRVIFFREIRLYNDRIVEVRDWSERHVELPGAVVQIFDTPLLWGFTRICNRGDHGISMIFKGVFCDHRLMKRNDVHKLHAFLAEFSGRDIKEFKSTGLLINLPLRKEQ